LARAALRQDIHAGVELAGGREVWLHYGGEPVLRPGIARDVEVSVVPGTAGQVEVTAPDGWRCERLGPARFRLHAAGTVEDRNVLSVTVDADVADFVVLGPGEAGGYEAGANVPSCPHCRARIEACMCEPSEGAQEQGGGP
ncbi:MAG: hypothetical protein ACYS5V_07910, partial [Planctomycetota bacterium]